MRVICSYCRAELAPKEPLEDDAVTHTMCPECLDHFGRQAEGWSLGELLDQFDVPVLAVDCDGRAIAANQATADMVGKSRRELFGLLGGDLMECAYARLPGGCGKTIHCKACAIRNAVEKTMETGSPQMSVPAYLNQADGRVNMRISTSRIPTGVVLIIEELSKTVYADGGRSLRAVPSE